MNSYGLSKPPRGFTPRGGGSWRGGRGKGNAPGHNPFERKEPTEAEIMQGLTDKIDFISLPASEVGVTDNTGIVIDNFEAIASYSWDDSVTPTIIVPASPLVWKDRQMPYTVSRDSGMVYVDENASRLSSSPLLPLIAAVSHHAPDFDLSAVDFVTDRNGLRKLLRWASGDENSGSFRLDLEFVGINTILMQRWELFTEERGGPGYEKEFEKESTRPAPGCETASCHARIITYDMDGLKMLIRYWTDASLPTQPPKDDNIKDLATALEKLTVRQPKTEVKKIPTFDGKHLNIITKGILVPQSSLLELKTRSVKSVDNFDWNDTYPQLLLSQTPNMFVCVHEYGTFKEVRKKTLAELEKSEVAKKTANGLRKLKNVLEEIREIVLGEGEGARLSLVCMKEAKEISIFKREGTGGGLPEEILQQFEP